MKQNTDISHRILMSLVLFTALFLLTGCPQFNRDIDPDYKLFGSKKNDPQNTPAVTGAVLAIDKALMASNEKLYANGTTASSSSKNILYEISPDAEKADDVKNIAQLESQIILIKELQPGELIVCSKEKIFIYQLETSAMSEEPFVSFDEGCTILDVINFNENILVITGDSTGNTQWTFVDESGNKSSIDFPGSSGIPCGKEYIKIPNKNVVLFVTDDSFQNLCAVKFGLSSDMPKGYFYESQYKDISAFVSPVVLLKENRLISGDGKIFKIDINLKDGETVLNSDWCKKSDEDTNLSYDHLVSVTDKYIWFSKNNKDSCTFERRINKSNNLKFSSYYKTYAGEKGVGLFIMNISFSDRKKTYLITNSIANNCVNFHLAQNELAADE